jgi:S1-C subfamily serine protease
MNFRVSQLLGVFVLIFLSQLSVFAQRTAKEYYNDEGKLCDSVMSSGYTIVNYNAANFPIGIVTFYDLQGRKLWEGSYHKYDRLDIKNDETNLYQGLCTWYYENGRKSESAYYDKGQLNGTITGWYESGNKRFMINFKNGTINGLLIRWYENGLLQHYGVFKDGKIVESEAINCDRFGDCSCNEFYKFSSRFNEKEYSHYDINKFLETDPRNNDVRRFREFETNSDVRFFTKFSKNETVDLKIRGRKGLRMEAKKKPGKVLLFKPLDYTKYFYIKGGLRHKDKKSKGKSGLVFAYQDDRNYQYYIMDALGEYEIGYFVDSVKTVIATGKASEPGYFDFNHYGDRKSRNLIKISFYKDTIRYLNGDEILFKQSKPDISAGDYIGYWVEKGVKISSTSFFARYNINAPFVSAEMEKQSTKNKIWDSNGSGIVISKDGYIATNYHVIDAANDIEVDLLRDGVWKSHRCEVVLKDPKLDLAIIKIVDSSFVSYDTIDYSIRQSLAEVGENVYALGYPLMITGILGNELKFSEGTINARTGYKGDMTTYQISSPIQPGNSGGPVFDYQGNLVGIVCSKIENADNVAFAIKVINLTSLMQMLPKEPVFPGKSKVAPMEMSKQVKGLTQYIPLVKTR